MFDFLKKKRKQEVSSSIPVEEEISFTSFNDAMEKTHEKIKPVELNPDSHFLSDEELEQQRIEGERRASAKMYRPAPVNGGGNDTDEFDEAMGSCEFGNSYSYAWYTDGYCGQDH